jgi:hypothetical protein
MTASLFASPVEPRLLLVVLVVVLVLVIRFPPPPPLLEPVGTKPFKAIPGYSSLFNPVQGPKSFSLQKIGQIG